MPPPPSGGGIKIDITSVQETNVRLHLPEQHAFLGYRAQMHNIGAKIVGDNIGKIVYTKLPYHTVLYTTR